MNGVMPGPLWLAIASAGNSPSTSSGNPGHHSISDTVAGKKTENQKNITNRQPKGDGDDGATTASGESGDSHGNSFCGDALGVPHDQVVQCTNAKGDTRA